MTPRVCTQVEHYADGVLSDDLIDDKTHDYLIRLKNHAHHYSTSTQKSTNDETLDAPLYLLMITRQREYQNLLITI